MGTALATAAQWQAALHACEHEVERLRAALTDLASYSGLTADASIEQEAAAFRGLRDFARAVLT